MSALRTNEPDRRRLQPVDAQLGPLRAQVLAAGVGRGAEPGQPVRDVAAVGGVGDVDVADDRARPDQRVGGQQARDRHPELGRHWRPQIRGMADGERRLAEPGIGQRDVAVAGRRHHVADEGGDVAERRPRQVDARRPGPGPDPGR
jgi:hypothetical protein